MHGEQKKAKAAKKAPTHPACSVMITAAIAGLKERGGSSAQKIRSCIAANYKVDMDKLKQHIKRVLKSGVAKGTLVQASGKGASGKFKLGKTDAEKAKKKKAVAAARCKAAKAKAAAKRKARKQRLAAKKAAAKAKKAAKKAKNPPRRPRSQQKRQQSQQ